MLRFLVMLLSNALIGRKIFKQNQRLKFNIVHRKNTKSNHNILILVFCMRHAREFYDIASQKGNTVRLRTIIVTF